MGLGVVADCYGSKIGVAVIAMLRVIGRNWEYISYMREWLKGGRGGPYWSCNGRYECRGMDVYGDILCFYSFVPLGGGEGHSEPSVSERLGITPQSSSPFVPIPLAIYTYPSIFLLLLCHK